MKYAEIDFEMDLAAALPATAVPTLAQTAPKPAEAKPGLTWVQFNDQDSPKATQKYQDYSKYG